VPIPAVQGAVIVPPEATLSGRSLEAAAVMMVWDLFAVRGRVMVACFDGLGVLITGAATGLGAATALGVARRGARVIINYGSSRSAAEATADACRGAGAEVRIVQGNVADDADCRRIAEAVGDWGRLDALINNAGATKHAPHGDLDALSADDFYRLLGVNTVGPFQMVRATR
jgi:3-oxoacyl-[acyl-carrier protein] reductase